MKIDPSQYFEYSMEFQSLPMTNAILAISLHIISILPKFPVRVVGSLQEIKQKHNKLKPFIDVQLLNKFSLSFFFYLYSLMRIKKNAIRNNGKTKKKKMNYNSAREVKKPAPKNR